MVAAIGIGDVFSKGRDFAAWPGLVPRQFSTGDRTILGKISKHGNRYLRVLFVQTAWMVLYSRGAGSATGSRRGSGPPRSGCTITCLLPRSPTSWPALRGRFSARNATSKLPGQLRRRPSLRKRDSGSSRRGLQTVELEQRQRRRPASMVPARGAPVPRTTRRPGRRNCLTARTMELHQ